MEILLVVLSIACLVIGFLIGQIIGKIQKEKYWLSQVETIRSDAISRSRAVLAGQFSEQLAPFLPNFPFKPTECKFIGKPIDFLVFEGLDEKDVQKIHFVEVKSGKSKLSGTEKSVKEAITEKKIEWHEYRIDDEITK